MKILFVASQVYLPQLYGGVQTSTDELCVSLYSRAHNPSLLVKAMPGGIFGFVARVKMRINKLRYGKSVACDRGFGYPVWRAWNPADVFDFVCDKERPDLIVVMTGGKLKPLAKRVQQRDIPVLVQLHDVAFDEYSDNFLALTGAIYVANSEFTARQYRERYNIDARVINPFVAVSKYCAKPHRENVTFINPVYEKGVDLAFALAQACPFIPFVFIEGWTLSAEQSAALAERLRQTPNVRFLPSQRNMASVYEKCKILIVPSLFEETFGRVVAEAQANGIPVIAAKRGGLPETVGSGGILIDTSATVEEWSAELTKLWNNDDQYGKLSRAAILHARRPEMDHSLQTDLWENAFLEAVRLQKDF